MKVIFFSKWSKFYVDFENAIKFSENVDGLEDNCVWQEWQLWQECMWAAVNVLKSGPKISDPTKRDHKHLDLFDIKGKLA